MSLKRELGEIMVVTTMGIVHLVEGQPRYRHSNSNPSGWKKTSAAKREDKRGRERRARDNGNYNPNRNYNGPYYNGKKYYHNNRNYYNGCCWWHGECQWSHCSQGDVMNDFLGVDE